MQEEPILVEKTKNKTNSMQRKSCALKKRIDGILDVNANETRTLEVSSQEAKSENKAVLQTDLRADSNGLDEKSEVAIVAKKDVTSNIESTVLIQEKRGTVFKVRRNRAILLISLRVEQLVLLLRRNSKNDFSRKFCVKMEKGALRLQVALANEIKKKVHKQMVSPRKMLMNKKKKNQFERSSGGGKKTGGLVRLCRNKIES